MACEWEGGGGGGGGRGVTVMHGHEGVGAGTDPRIINGVRVCNPMIITFPADGPGGSGVPRCVGVIVWNGIG